MRGSIGVWAFAIAVVVFTAVVVAGPAGAGAAAIDGGEVATTGDASIESGTHGVAVEGTVTDEGGDPVEEAYVLVQASDERMLQNATTGEDPVRRALLDLVEEQPFGLYWNTTTGDGSYLVHVPRPGDYEAIAVSEDGVSRIENVSVRLQIGERDLAVEEDRLDRPEGTPTRTDERWTFRSPETPGETHPTGLYLLSASVFAVGLAFAGYALWRTRRFR